MNKNNEIEEVVGLLVDHEKVVGDLYRVYAERFSDKELWSQLAKEEDLHADWISAFYEDKYKGKIQIKDGFNREQIWQSIKRIRQLAEDASTYDESTAVGYALALENAMIESEFIDVFDEDDKEVRAVMLNILSGTNSHRGRLEKKFREVLKKGG